MMDTSARFYYWITVVRTRLGCGREHKSKTAPNGWDLPEHDTFIDA